MLTAASAAYHRAKGEQEIELVWTGPSSKLIATRKTEQALLQVIDAAESRLFITSFVAYDIASIMSALATPLSVACRFDAARIQRQAWRWRLHGRYRQNESGSSERPKFTFGAIRVISYAGGKVHAKVAVCDETICFVSSANLTGHAMERNMEAGVLITRGGSVCR